MHTDKTPIFKTNDKNATYTTSNLVVAQPVPTATLLFQDLRCHLLHQDLHCHLLHNLLLQKR